MSNLNNTEEAIVKIKESIERYENGIITCFELAPAIIHATLGIIKTCQTINIDNTQELNQYRKAARKVYEDNM